MKIYFKVLFYVFFSLIEFWKFLILEMIFRNRKKIDTTQLDMFFDSIKFEGIFGFWFSNFIINSCQFKIKPKQSTASATNYRSVSLSKSYRKYLKVIYCIYHSNFFCRHLNWKLLIGNDFHYAFDLNSWIAWIGILLEMSICWSLN